MFVTCCTPGHSWIGDGPDKALDQNVPSGQASPPFGTRRTCSASVLRFAEKHHAEHRRHHRLTHAGVPSRQARPGRLPEPVRAGFPSPADDFIEEEIDVQRLLIVNRLANFLVRIAGDSMILARLFDRDLTVVGRSPTPRTGDVVVVDIDGEHSFKVWKRQGPRSTLHFANPGFPPFQVSPNAVIQVQGGSGSVCAKRRCE